MLLFFISDIEFNKQEIEKQRKVVCIELDNLKVFIERLRECSGAVDDNFKNIKKCLILREGRLGIDLCLDTVERELKNEVRVVEGVLSLLRRSSEQANEQVCYIWYVMRPEQL